MTRSAPTRWWLAAPASAEGTGPAPVSAAGCDAPPPPGRHRRRPDRPQRSRVRRFRWRRASRAGGHLPTSDDRGGRGSIDAGCRTWPSSWHGNVADGEQSHRAGTDDRERIEVGDPTEQPPVQAGSRQAVTADQVERRDHVARIHVVADGNGRRHGFVGGAEGPVGDGDDAATGEHAGERDHALHLPHARCADVPRRSTPRWPLLQRSSGGSKPCTTSFGTGRSGHCQAVAALHPAPRPRCPGHRQAGRPGRRRRAAHTRAPGEAAPAAGCGHAAEIGAGVRRSSRVGHGPCGSRPTRTAACGRFRAAFAEVGCARPR